MLQIWEESPKLVKRHKLVTKSEKLVNKNNKTEKEK